MNSIIFNKIEKYLNIEYRIYVTWIIRHYTAGIQKNN